MATNKYSLTEKKILLNSKKITEYDKKRRKINKKSPLESLRVQKKNLYEDSIRDELTEWNSL